MLTIIQKDEDPKGILRKKAKEVPLSDITSPKIKKLLADMKEAVTAEDDGVAIAAPQVGKLLRIFVVSKRAFEAADEEEGHDLVFINPKIVKRSRKKQPVDEGCLSIRPWYGIVNRSEKVTITAYDEMGEKVTRGASGLLAQIFQHEIDHLDGILFTDKAENLHKLHALEE